LTVPSGSFRSCSTLASVPMARSDEFYAAEAEVLPNDLGDKIEAEALARSVVSDQHLDGAVGQLQELQHAGQRADGVDRVGGRVVVGGVDLGGRAKIQAFTRSDEFYAAEAEVLPNDLGDKIEAEALDATVSASFEGSSIWTTAETTSGEIFLFSLT
jgi:hypothetical protein